MSRPKSGSLVTFFLLTFGVTWVSWIAAWAIPGGGASAGHLRPGPGMPFFYIGTFAPAFVAAWLTARHEGSAGVRELLRRLVQWHVGLRWYVFALTYFAAIKLAAALIHRLATGEWPRFGDEPFYLMIAAIIGTTRQSFPMYLLSVTALSVVIAWVYANTNGSLFLTMLMHSAINNAKDIVPSGGQGPGNPFALHATAVGWITAGLLWACAGYFLVRMSAAPANQDVETGMVSTGGVVGSGFRQTGL